MRKAFIYYNGQLIAFVNFEKIDSTERGIFLTAGYGDDKKTVAVVPLTHFILIE